MSRHPPSSWRRGFDGGLGPRRLSRASCLRPGRWAGLGRTLWHHRLWGRFGSAARRPFPLLGTQGDRALSRGAILFIVHNDMGGGSFAPRCLGPLRSLRPPSGLRPLQDIDPPPTGGTTSSSYPSSSSQCVPPLPSTSETEVSGESGGGSPAFSASQRFLAEVSRRCAFLTLFAFLSSFAFFCSSFRARFLARSSLSSRTGGRESLTIPIPCKRVAIRAKAGRKKNKRKIKDKSDVLREKCSPSRGSSAPLRNPLDPGAWSSRPRWLSPSPTPAPPASASQPRGRPGSSQT